MKVARHAMKFVSNNVPKSTLYSKIDIGNQLSAFIIKIKFSLNVLKDMENVI